VRILTVSAKPFLLYSISHVFFSPVLSNGSSPVYFNPETEEQAIPNPDALPYINFCIRLMVSNDDGILVNWLDIEFFFFLQVKNVGFFEDRRTLLALAHIQEEEEEEDTSRDLPWFQNEEQRSRKLLNCIDGFSVVFSIGNSLTVSPAPSAPTISPAPTPYEGVIIDPKEPLDLTKDKTSFNASEFYNVLAYLCHDDLEPLTAEEQSTFVRSQGSATIRVCIERNAKCVRDSVYIRRIDAFSWFRGTVRQIAVAPVNLPADNGLTELYCVPGSHKCWFDSLLMADFFTTPGLVSGSGAASLQFGSSSSTINRRFLQESNDNVGKTRGFSLRFFTTAEELVVAEEEEAFKIENDAGFLKLGGIMGIVLACLLALGCLVLACRGRGYHCCRRCLPVSKTPDHKTEVLEDASLDGFSEASFHHTSAGGADNIERKKEGTRRGEKSREKESKKKNKGLEDSSLDGFPEAPSHTHRQLYGVLGGVDNKERSREGKIRGEKRREKERKRKKGRK
jgi:hypothetical protein